jgi:hypothetical protein
MEIDDTKKSLELVWHDVYDLDVYVSTLSFHSLLDTDWKLSKTGEWEPVEGETYYAKDAKTEGEAFKQEAVSLCRYSPATRELTIILELCKLRRYRNRYLREREYGDLRFYRGNGKTPMGFLLLPE